MTSLLAADPLMESRRFITLLEQHAAGLPFAAEHLELHRRTWQALEHCQHRSDTAVATWRTALAHRWEREVAGRRLYKQIYRQYVEFYGSADCPEVQRIADGHSDSNASPADLLIDLRRLHADLALHPAAPFVARCSDVLHACATLELALHEASRCEAERRSAVLERRIVQESFRRACLHTQRAISEHFSSAIPLEFDELFVGL